MVIASILSTNHLYKLRISLFNEIQINKLSLPFLKHYDKKKLQFLSDWYWTRVLKFLSQHFNIWKLKLLLQEGISHLHSIQSFPLVQINFSIGKKIQDCIASPYLFESPIIENLEVWTKNILLRVQILFAPWKNSVTSTLTTSADRFKPL